jgi:hypothetical protein
MSRTAFPRTLMVTAVLFGLVSTGFASIALVKAPHNLPHRAAMAKSYAANRSSTARSDHVAADRQFELSRCGPSSAGGCRRRRFAGGCPA